MRVKVYYAGDKACIQEVAIQIAGQAKQNSDPLPPSYMPENLALAFIGTAAKGAKPDKRAMDFIAVLDPKRVEAAALYCTSSSKDGSCLNVMADALRAKGIKVYGETLICNGKGTFGGKMPTDEDMANARAFADRALKDVTDHNI